MTSGTFSRLGESLPALRVEPVDDGPALRRYPGLVTCRDLIGGTTLLDVPSPEGGARIVAKCEFENPAGSIKDRIAYGLLCQAIRDHDEDGPPLRILGWSSGSLARAFGYLRAFTGIPMRFALPASVPPSWLRAIQAYGVRVDLVDDAAGEAGLAGRALEIAATEPGWTSIDIHDLPVVAVHRYGTGEEILRELGGRRPTHWVGGLGSAGALAGVALALRSRFPDLGVVAVTPADMPYGTEEGPAPSAGDGAGDGLPHPFVEAFVPDAVHVSVTAQDAFAAMRRFLRLTAIRVGGASAAGWLAAWRLAATLPPDALVVTVLTDSGPPEEWERANNS
ncbi:pyridoxal-phosphate dependent enzyme [Microbispora sp. ATCC PTA-5024]|uniref:pyridoxal-phosphate dependent enzyme n=1 Tax=Microbispora sp. ATCC PTA-5024 TaxID=316330 RepID=UPI0003DD37E8|nr:pyridoxal-phosphate dependent enzyme [Microbispora sp. ATCC PTA-5024]ETK35456.1 hypothetical protein MPTA5024_14065 [Microbispora sp. ATCC PTA-5024]